MRESNYQINRSTKIKNKDLACHGVGQFSLYIYQCSAFRNDIKLKHNHTQPTTRRAGVEYVTGLFSG